MEDDRHAAVDLAARSRPSALELDVARAGDVARLALVALAHVDERRAGGLELGCALRRDLDLWVLERVHRRPGYARPGELDEACGRAIAARRRRDPSLAVLLRAAGCCDVTRAGALFCSRPPVGFGSVRTLELVAIIVLGVVVLSGDRRAVVTRWLGGWSEREAEFELRVRRTRADAPRDARRRPRRVRRSSSSTRCATRTSRSSSATRSTSCPTCSRTRSPTSRS